MIDKLSIWTVLFLLMVAIVSCQSTLADRYTEDELVNIMFDAHTLGLIYNRQEEKSDILKDAYYEVIYERYGLDQDEFQKVVEGLVMNAELYDRVYDKMVKKAEQLEQRSMEGN